MEAITATASHKKDTPRYRVFQVDEDQGIVGSLYVELEEGDDGELSGEGLPTRVAIRVAEPQTRARKAASK